jgi:serine phosphatase RsbU (regulator of sigma subunit)
VTAGYAVVDTETRRVRFANAGHLPPLLQRRGNANAPLETEHGLILGFAADVHYTNNCIEQFAAGDRILFKSDGNQAATSRHRAVIRRVPEPVRILSAACPDDPKTLA